MPHYEVPLCRCCIPMCHCGPCCYSSQSAVRVRLTHAAGLPYMADNYAYLDGMDVTIGSPIAGGLGQVYLCQESTEGGGSYVRTLWALAFEESLAGNGVSVTIGADTFYLSCHVTTRCTDASYGDYKNGQVRIRWYDADGVQQSEYYFAWYGEACSPDPQVPADCCALIDPHTLHAYTSAGFGFFALCGSSYELINLAMGKPGLGDATNTYTLGETIDVRVDVVGNNGEWDEEAEACKLVEPSCPEDA